MIRVLICLGIAFAFLTCIVESVRAEEFFLYQYGGSVYAAVLQEGKVQNVPVSKSEESVLTFEVYESSCLLVVNTPDSNSARKVIQKDRRGELNVMIVNAFSLPHFDSKSPIAFNGKAVAYVEVDGKTSSLAVLDLETEKTQTLLTQVDKPLCSPKWSPDGKSVAYYSASKGSGFMLESINVANGTRTVLSSASKPTGFGSVTPRPPFWSGDGKKLYFEAAYGDKIGPNLYEVSADGSGSARHICAGLLTAFDGASGTAFVVTKLNVYSVLVTKPASEPKLVVEQAWWARVSPSGKYLGYYWSDALYIRNLGDGSSIKAVPDYRGDGPQTAWIGSDR